MATQDSTNTVPASLSAQMSVANSGPGLCLIAAKITQPHILTAVQVSKWYEECHIPRLMATCGFSCMLRGLVGGNGSYPFVSIYAMPDIAFANSKEFKLNIGPDHAVDLDVHALPGGVKISDAVEVDFRIYKQISGCQTGGTPLDKIKAFALVEVDYREARSEEFRRKEFEESFAPLVKSIPSSVFRERYALETEWWSAGGCLYNRDHLDFYGFDEEEPDYYGHFERVLQQPNAPDLDGYNLEIKTYTVIYSKQAEKSI